jgi:hypothetical protein
MVTTRRGASSTPSSKKAEKGAELEHKDWENADGKRVTSAVKSVREGNVDPAYSLN